MGLAWREREPHGQRPMGSEGAQGGPGGQPGQRGVFGFCAKSVEDAVLSQSPCLSRAHLEPCEPCLAPHGPGNEVISLALEASQDPPSHTSP